MAIDTRDRRAAGFGFMLPFGAILPDADSYVGQVSDRQIVSFSYPIIISLTVYVEPHRYLYWSDIRVTESDMKYIGLVAGVPTPEAVPGYTVIYVDEADGWLKSRKEDGTIAIFDIIDTTITDADGYVMIDSDGDVMVET